MFLLIFYKFKKNFKIIINFNFYKNYRNNCKPKKYDENRFKNFPIKLKISNKYSILNQNGMWAFFG